MGSLLCKKSRNDSPMSPVDRVIGRCAQICPQNIGKKKHFWDKQVLETSPPPLQQQPKLNSPDKSTQQGWETATLTVPDSPGDGTIPPIAPPRKKRPSMSPKKEVSKKREQMMNRDHAENSNDKTTSENVATTESHISETDPEKTDSIGEPSSPTKVTSRVGNKKSDKFFGENLSDSLSAVEISSSLEDEKKQLEPSDTQPEHPSSDKDEVDNAKQSADIIVPNKDVQEGIEISEETEEMLRKINKERGELIFALEKQCKKNEECAEYEGQSPVVEEMIVPVKRKPRHICDDEDCLRKLLHNAPTPDPIAPKKPQRDFTKYKRSVESVKSTEINDSSHEQKPKTEEPPNPAETGEIKDSKVTRDTLRKETESSASEASGDEKCALLKSSQENSFLKTETVPNSAYESIEESPPPIPPKLKKRSETTPEKTVPVERLKRKSDAVPPNMSNSEKILRRCLSTQSYLTPDLVDKIAQQANSLSLSALYLPEDYASSCNDGSGLVSPNYKLTEKRKLSSQISRTDQTRPEDDRTGVCDSTSERQSEKGDNINVEKPFEKEETETKAVVTKEKLLENSLKEKSKEAVPKEEHQKIVAEENAPISISEKPVQCGQITSQISQTSDSSELGNERKLKKRISVNTSTSEEISNTIQSFLGKDDLTPKTVLKLLEDEFGEMLHSKNLPPEDKEIIEQLRKSAALNQEKLSQENQSENVELNIHQNESENEAEIAQNKTATLESNAKLTKSQHYSKIPKLKNKALDAVETGERRRHSIDELESWFHPKSENIQRRREASLPGCLDSPDTEDIQICTNSAKDETRQFTEIGNEHSSLLKFLENEKNNH